MTHLVQILLPLYANDGSALPATLLADVRDELIARFGGLTAYTRSPAKGLWQPGPGPAVQDDIVIYELMTDAPLDAAWWRAYRAGLEARFRQQVVVIRAQRIRML